MNTKTSSKKKMILDFVSRQVEEKGYPPSVREICNAVGLKSTSTVHGYLEKLEREGFIVKDPAKPRALKIIGGNSQSRKGNSAPGAYYSGRELVDIPVVGRVTAGMPILAVENIEDTFPLPAEYIKNATAFMLKVKGDSMTGAGIFDNDMVLVKQQPTAENGEIVVALIDDEATVKSFYREKGHVRLQPQNQYMDPIIVHDNLTILGKVIGVFRML